MGREQIAERFFDASRVTRHLSLLLSVLLVGCTIPQVPARTIYEDPTNFVRLELDPKVLPDQPWTTHNHPISLSAETVAYILKGFTVRDRKTFIQIWITGEAPVMQAFRDEEITLLAPRLAEALQVARPNERITFYLSYPQTSIKREITSGGIYVRGDELHFVLSNQREIYGIPAYGMIYDRRYPLLPIAPKDFDLFFEPQTAVVPRRFSLWDNMWGLEKDEVVIDLNRVHRPTAVTWRMVSDQATRPSSP